MQSVRPAMRALWAGSRWSGRGCQQTAFIRAEALQTTSRAFSYTPRSRDELLTSQSIGEASPDSTISSTFQTPTTSETEYRKVEGKSVYPTKSAKSPEELSAIRLKLRYHVSRSKNQLLPLYQKKKSGGNQKLTQIRRIAGQASDLRQDLIKELGYGVKDVNIVQPANYITVKGHVKIQLTKFLLDKGF